MANARVVMNTTAFNLKGGTKEEFLKVLELFKGVNMFIKEGEYDVKAEYKLFHNGDGFVYDIDDIYYQLEEEEDNKELKVLEENSITNLLQLIQHYMDPKEIDRILYKEISNTKVRSIYGFSAIITKDNISTKTLFNIHDLHPSSKDKR
jgi:hypothetical protein